MVEASMVLPLLILSVLTCVLISMFFYDTTVQQCLLHRDLRCTAGELTGHTRYTSRPEGEDRDLTASRDGVFQVVSGKEHTGMLHKGLLQERVSRDLESLWHASDGVTYVRYCATIKKLNQDK